MPGNVNEADWEKAKKLAAEQGQKDNYAYIQSIYQNLQGKKEATFYHGTDANGLAAIKQSGLIKKGTYISKSKQVASTYSKQKGGDGKYLILELNDDEYEPSGHSNQFILKKDYRFTKMEKTTLDKLHESVCKKKLQLDKLHESVVLKRENDNQLADEIEELQAKGKNSDNVIQILSRKYPAKKKKIEDLVSMLFGESNKKETAVEIQAGPDSVGEPYRDQRAKATFGKKYKDLTDEQKAMIDDNPKVEALYEAVVKKEKWVDYKLTKKNFLGDVGDHIVVDWDRESPIWKNLTKDTSGSPISNDEQQALRKI